MEPEIKESELKLQSTKKTCGKIQNGEQSVKESPKNVARKEELNGLHEDSVTDMQEESDEYVPFEEVSQNEFPRCEAIMKHCDLFLKHINSVLTVALKLYRKDVILEEKWWSIFFKCETHGAQELWEFFHRDPDESHHEALYKVLEDTGQTYLAKILRIGTTGTFKGITKKEGHSSVPATQKELAGLRTNIRSMNEAQTQGGAPPDKIAHNGLPKEEFQRLKSERPPCCEVIQRNRPFILDHTNNVGTVALRLYKKGILLAENCVGICNTEVQKGPTDAMDDLLELLCRDPDESHHDTFYKVLEDTGQEYLASTLKSRKTDIADANVPRASNLEPQTGHKTLCNSIQKSKQSKSILGFSVKQWILVIILIILSSVATKQGMKRKIEKVTLEIEEIKIKTKEIQVEAKQIQQEWNHEIQKIQKCDAEREKMAQEYNHYYQQKIQQMIKIMKHEHKLELEEAAHKCVIDNWIKREEMGNDSEKWVIRMAPDVIHIVPNT